MWLINVQIYTLHLFSDPVTEPYAILSHTWNDEEITFQDMKDLAIARTKAGFAKIEEACKLALSNGLQYVWVDTCCIDKSASAELSEAINSMFNWYKNAVVCYAFLSDLPSGDRMTATSDFGKCKWFTRGWTLQELIAPTHLLFVDSEWRLAGAKKGLAKEIQDITGIDDWMLNDSSLLETIPLAKRMSWASQRQTTRVEDQAYCLMGIFDVNMPMIYGEGPNAFLRLQEEILRRTTDLSIFAWQATAHSTYHGILALSPAEFWNSGSVFADDDQFCFRDEISMTNKGVKINTALQYYEEGLYMMDLHCFRQESDGTPTRLGVYLKRTLDTYFRHSPELTAEIGVVPGSLPKPIFLASVVDARFKRAMENSSQNRRICIDFPKETHPCRVHDIRAVPNTYWHSNENLFSLQGLSRFRGFVRFSVTSRLSSENPDYGTSKEDTSQIILVCDLLNMGELRLSLYAESGLQSSPQPAGFIDPFTNIDGYGPLGDPFSLSVLSPGDEEDRSLSIIHRDQRLNYVVSASLAMPRFAHFRITVKVKQQNQTTGEVQYTKRPTQGRLQLEAPKQDDPGYDRYRGDQSTF